jgi:hypothetical protein
VRLGVEPLPAERRVEPAAEDGVGVASRQIGSDEQEAGRRHLPCDPRENGIELGVIAHPARSAGAGSGLNEMRAETGCGLNKG